MIKKWSKKEIEFLKGNYSKNKDKELSKKINRSLKGISYMAWKLRLKKDKDFYCKSRRHLNFEIKKRQLIKLYIKEKNSIRDCAKKLKKKKFYGFFFFFFFFTKILNFLYFLNAPLLDSDLFLVWILNFFK